MWWLYALLSTVFAALTAVLAKIGSKGVASTLATATCTVVMLGLGLAWGIVYFWGGLQQVGLLTRTNLLFLGLAGLATGLSWLFCFRALQLGKVSQVAPVDKLSVAMSIVLPVVFLGEKLTWHAGIGALLIIGGPLVLIWG